MTIGLFALLAASLGAAWFLYRLSTGASVGEGGRAMTILKLVVWFGLIAALGAAKLWPLAFMVLIAAGGVMAIEAWKERQVAEDEAAEAASRPAPPARQADMTMKEAAAFLGVTEDASADEIKAAHRKLIAQIHPDKGGTDYLAAKINEARDFMLDRLDDGDA